MHLPHDKSVHSGHGAVREPKHLHFKHAIFIEHPLQVEDPYAALLQQERRA